MAVAVVDHPEEEVVVDRHRPMTDRDRPVPPASPPTQVVVVVKVVNNPHVHPPPHNRTNNSTIHKDQENEEAVDVAEEGETPTDSHGINGEIPCIPNSIRSYNNNSNFLAGSTTRRPPYQAVAGDTPCTRQRPVWRGIPTHNIHTSNIPTMLLPSPMPPMQPTPPLRE